jgi:predicted phosphodiesterase
MRIGIAGDWHKNVNWAEKAIAGFAAAKVHEIWHLGDIGFIGTVDGINFYIDKMQEAIDNSGHPMKLYVVLGNHEDYDWVERQSASADGLIWLTKDIVIVPRGYEFERDKRRFLAVSGASSIDYKQRTRGLDWFLQENISRTEADDIIRNVIPGTIDVMLCHDAPTGIPELDIAALEGRWDMAERHYAETSRIQLNRIFQHVMPTQLWHGHWHRRVRGTFPFSGFQTAIYGLDREFSDENMAVLDTRRLSVQDITCEGVPKPRVGDSFRA